MIRLGALFPDHLNLNGDLGNLEVLSRQLGWRGVPNEIVPIRSLSDLNGGFDFLLIGHGSIAAWADVKDDLLVMAPLLRELKQRGTPALAISSGFEELVRLSVFSPLSVSKLAERVSKFEVVSDGDNELLGYVNTDTNLPAFYRSDSWIGSTLHGPILAKNPTLLNEILTTIASQSGIELPEIRKSEKADLLVDLVREVWKLEQGLARE
jgi:CobQ-like glutamine amidotransferase family enzyme